MANRKRSGTRGARKRRGKSEAMTGAKEGAVETRQATMALNVASGDKIVHYMKAVKGTKEKMTTLSGQLRNIYKQAKAEHVSKATIDDLLALERGDPEVFRQEMECLAVGLKAVGAPFQMQIFDTAYGTPVEAAAAKGRQDAEASRFAENTYPEGSAESNAYAEAYQSVQASRVNGGNASTDETEDEEGDEDATDLRSSEQREREPAHAH